MISNSLNIFLRKFITVLFLTVFTFVSTNTFATGNDLAKNIITQIKALQKASKKLTNCHFGYQRLSGYLKIAKHNVRKGEKLQAEGRKNRVVQRYKSASRQIKSYKSQVNWLVSSGWIPDTKASHLLAQVGSIKQKLEQLIESTNDQEAPVISLIGDNPIEITRRSVFIDPGATALDNVDGVVPVQTSGTVDSSTIGEYTITYTASDAAGNEATAKRLVIVTAISDPSVSIGQGLTSIELEEGENKLVAFIVDFIDGSDDVYNIAFEQTVTPNDNGVTISSDYPLAGWQASDDNSWVVNVTIGALIAGDYVLESVVTLAETGETKTITLPIRVVPFGSTGKISLTTPGGDFGGLSVNQTASVIFTAKVQNTTAPPTSITLVQINEENTQKLGELLDNGENDDLVLNDNVYTGAFTVTAGLTEGFIHFKATSGTGSELVESEVYALKVTRFPIGIVPPDSNSIIDDGQGGQVVVNELLVVFIDGTSSDRIEEIVSAEDGVIVGTLPNLGPFQIKLANNNTLTDLDNSINSFESYDEVDYAESNSISATNVFIPDDPSFSSQTNMKVIRADEAWALSRGNTLIAVIDSGVDYNHPDLSAKVVKGKDFIDGDNDPLDENGHGTHVAGIAAASSNNKQSVAGVAWGSRILAIRQSDRNGRGTVIGMASSIRRAADRGAKIINYSSSIGVHKKSLERAVTYAVGKGVLLIASAGNTATSVMRYPCAYDSVLCVGNSTNTDGRAASSTYGSWVDIAAPGEGVVSTKLGGGVTTKTGTSMSAPLVAGAAAVVWSLHPEWTAAKVRERLISSGKPIEAALNIGATRLDLFEAIFNGNFELGSLAEWTATGTASSVEQLGSIKAKDDFTDKRMALLSTGPAGDESKTILIKNLNIQDGVTNLNFKFEYNFISDEYPEYVGSQFDDTLLVELIAPDGTKTELVRESINVSSFTPISGISLPGGDETVGQTGIKAVNVNVPVRTGSGQYSIKISDLGDDIYDSILLIDNIRLK